jgi:hypothetical protein
MLLGAEALKEYIHRIEDSIDFDYGLSLFELCQNILQESTQHQITETLLKKIFGLRKSFLVTLLVYSRVSQEVLWL